jgi:sporulation protein YlmC with PRC-barrel domain
MAYAASGARVAALLAGGTMTIAYSDELKGRAVIDATGLILGDVDDLLVDAGAWRIEALRVKVRRDAAGTLGVPTSVMHATTIDVPTEHIQSVGQTIVLARAATDFISHEHGAEEERQKATGT